MYREMRYRCAGAPPADSIFQSIVQAGIALALGPRLVPVLQTNEIAIFRDPEAVGEGIHPELGCEVRLRRQANPDCQCEVFRHFKSCEHSVGAWVLLQQPGKAAALEGSLAA